MKRLFFIFAVLGSIKSYSSEVILSWNYKNAELLTVVEAYSKATGAKFVVDSTVRGSISMLNQQKLSAEEAFNQLSKALALNGFSWIKNKDSYVIRNARSIQRDNIDVYTDPPPVEPEHMVSFIYKCKFLDCGKMASEIRVLTSSYGEMSASTERNSIIFTDFTGNINRVNNMLAKLDVPTEASVKK